MQDIEQEKDIEMLRIERGWFIICSMIFTLFVVCFTVIITLQTILISRQNNMERLVMMVLASQSPTEQLENMLEKYFSTNLENKVIVIDNKSMRRKKR